MKQIQKMKKMGDQTHANKLEKTITHKRLTSENTRFPDDFSKKTIAAMKPT